MPQSPERRFADAYLGSTPGTRTVSAQMPLSETDGVKETKLLRQELNDSRFEVVHRACNLYAAAGF
jgi:hypothetical protein